MINSASERFTVSFVTHAIIAEDLNEYLDYEGQTPDFESDDTSLTYELCQGYADALAKVDNYSEDSAMYEEAKAAALATIIKTCRA